MNSHQKKHRESVTQIISDPELDYHSITIRWAIILFVVGVLMAIISYSLPDGNEKNIFSLVGAHVMGVSASLFAAILPIENIRKKVAVKLSRMRNISDPDYLVDLLSKVAAFSQQTRKEEMITAVIKRRDASGVFVDITYKYKAKLRGRNVSFTFYRALTEELRSLTPQIMDNEFYWLMDEREIAPDNPEKIYSVLSLYINAEKIKDIRKIISNKNEVRFEATAPYTVNIGEEVDLHYTVRLPFSIEDYMFITHEFPTFGAEFTVDFTAIVDDVEVHVLPITGAVASKKIEGSDEAKVNYVYKGWIDPKNGYMVAWWAKKST
jgi:hypothetical protein